MHNYESLKEKDGTKVSQTIDRPIMILDHFELADAFIALFIVLIFGVIFYSWGIMFFLLFVFLGVGPVIKKNNNRGVFLHWPYKYFGLSLLGMMNPKNNKKYSD